MLLFLTQILVLSCGVNSYLLKTIQQICHGDGNQSSSLMFKAFIFKFLIFPKSLQDETKHQYKIKNDI